jgi:MarR family transcriptional regulator, organic hydroperoxide resistance regulator
MARLRSDATPSPDPAELPEALQFMRLLWELVHTLDRASKYMRTGIGVTGPQRLAIRVIGLFPGMTAGQLAHILHVHPSTLTGVLQRLTDQGFIARAAPAADRRRAELRLTAAGKRINQLKDGTVEATLTRVWQRASPRDRAATRRFVMALSAELRRQVGDLP